MAMLAESLTYEQQEAIHDALAGTTIKHIERNQGLISPLAFDPIAHPSQDLRTVHMPAVASTPDDLREHAEVAADYLYTYMHDSLVAQGALMGELRKRRLDSQGRRHMSFVTTHQQIQDVPALEAATSTAEYELFETNWPTIINTNGLVISRGVATLEALGLAASEIVQKAGHGFLSFPRTDSIENLDLPDDIAIEDLISDNNKHMREAYKRWLPTLPHRKPLARQPKKRGFLAWSGGTDGVQGDRYDPDAIELIRAHEGVVDLTKHGDTLPTVIWDRGPDIEPIFITGEITRVKSAPDVHRVQEWQRATLAKALGLADDKVTIVRSRTT